MTISITVYVPNNDVEINGGRLDMLRHRAAIPADDLNVMVAEGQVLIEPHSSLQASRTDTHIIPESRGRFYVANTGKAKEVKAVFFIGLIVLPRNGLNIAQWLSREERTAS